MTWPGWGEVLPLLATLVTAVATVIGAVVTWARISDRTVSRAVERAARQSEKAAREAADGVRAEVKALAEKLATNDFPHVEARIERGCKTWANGSTGDWRRLTPTGKRWRPGSESGSTAWVDASSAWRPGCWRRFSGGRTRKTPKPDLEYENAATVSSELGRLANADLAS